MKIKRVVNGIEHEFELTGTELYKAYIEQEHIYDLADVEAHLDNKCPADQLEEIAYEARRQMDKYGVSLDFAIEEAVHICESRRNSIDFFKDR